MFTQALKGSDARARAVVVAAVLAEALADAVYARAFALAEALTHALADVRALSDVRALVDALALADARARADARALVDALAPVDARALVDALALADARARADDLALALAGAIALADDRGRTVTTAIAGELAAILFDDADLLIIDFSVIGEVQTEDIIRLISVASDFTGADLHTVDLTGIPLEGVRWSDGTRWPEESSARQRVSRRAGAARSWVWSSGLLGGQGEALGWRHPFARYADFAGAPVTVTWPGR